MDKLFISDRIALTDAADLIARFGDNAVDQAAERARRSRNEGNVQRFCHWRQIERVVALLTKVQAVGTIH